ncbi:MAG: LacI family transcriptional regulator [Chloroflexi bacterium HGW-Chloroflexi-1]|nr:MAG: LacI family transcriptional regulator [Chloroflexi bacterium HGW-Chloroflexi-1]
MAKRVTIKDVAGRAGVSYQTVSRVINDKGEVSPAVRARVQAAIEELGYRPNAIARSMVRGRTHTLGCIAPNLIDYTFACYVEGAKAEARRCGYFLLAASAEQESEVAALCEEMLHSGRVDGLLAINPYVDGRHRCFETLVAQGAAIVYFGVGARDDVISSVRLDDEDGAYQATRHLIALGHPRIAMLAGPQNEDCVQCRNAGFARALQEAGLAAPSDTILTGDWSASSGYQAMQHWLTAGTSFTALFAQNDRMAVGAIRAARDHGRRVPQDLAVVGFDDMPLASYFDPPLTTIRQDLFEHGRQGTRILIEKIENPACPLERVVIPAQLVVRESCGSKLASSLVNQ